MKYLLEADRLGDLIAALQEDGRQVIGPTVSDGAIVYAPIAGVDALPRGVRDEQAPGRYRLENAGDDLYFEWAVGPHAWKRYLYPPEQKLYSAKGGDGGFVIEGEVLAAQERAFFAVRPCDLAAIEILDKVFDNGMFSDDGYMERRRRSIVVVVNCARPADTCFCASMDTGPAARNGFDIAMTEAGDGRYYIVEAGSDTGGAILDGMNLREASATEIEPAEKRLKDAAKKMRRTMIPNAREVLSRNIDSTRWEKIAKRCLNCANCTMACPTCFCSTVEDVTDLSGEHAERWRKWDSCFSLDFSYIHGGSLRRSGAARYRQWMTHKLTHWHEQFGTSGCVGCGRCITWCPVGIDITEEAKAFKHEEDRHG